MMSMFADSIADLRYQDGVVSFRLFCSGSMSGGAHINIPESQFREMLELLVREQPKIQEVHVNWLKMQVDLTLAAQSQPPQVEPSSTLGKKLASV